MTKQKIAIMKRDKTTYNGREFVSFDEVEYNTEKEKQKRIHEAVSFSFECECDDDSECEDECDFEHECDCEYWAIEVDMDVIRYGWYEDEFYTAKQVMEKEREERLEKKERFEREILATKDKIQKLQQDIEKMQAEIKKIELEDANEKAVCQIDL